MKLMKKTIILTIAIFILLGGVASANSWETIKENNEIKVGLCAAYPPFEYRNEKTGKLEGFDIDLANELAKELNIEADIIDAEWQALLGGLIKGDYDILITCMAKKEASIKNVNMSDVYYKLTNNIIVRENEDNIKSAAELKGKVVGVQLGSGSEQVVDKLTGLKKVRRYNYNNEAFIDLKNGRIDAVVVGYAYAVNQLPNYDGLKIIEKPLESADTVMVMKNGDNKLTQKINKALATLKDNGTYDQLVDKWLTVN